MAAEVLLVFDIGKTHKKVILFNHHLRMLHQEECRFEEILDDEGDPCEDAALLESWILKKLHQYLSAKDYVVKGVNFSTYGATLVHLDREGRRMAPIYNYLKDLPEHVYEVFFESYGGQEEFSRKCASPMLGMLNSGLQLLWLKRTKPEVFAQVRQSLHLPQYVSRLIHGQMVSELTSIGCHTMLWDFERMQYHSWLKEEGIKLPDPIPVSECFPVALEGNKLEAGIGIHDSSASLAPYIRAAPEPFILVSTGTWCINMNPFNQEVLTAEELSNDCLCFLGVHGKPVKSSRFFLGRIHDLNVERMEAYFGVGPGAYKDIDPGTEAIRKAWKKGGKEQVFFRKVIPEGWIDFEADLDQFGSFEEAYIRFMTDLTQQVIRSIRWIEGAADRTRHLYISGGFSRNPIFRHLLCLAFPSKEVYTSEVDNASSLGAALVMADTIWKGASDQFRLRLTRVKA
jgi:sugar (pentulose or hexulose) kinase